MKENLNILSKRECQYCQSNIKLNEDYILCPSCSAPYHKDCWYENEGCAVYGCNYKIVLEKEGNIKTFSSKDILTECEYLINRKNYTEAINKCNALLNIEPDNIDAKAIYNRIVTLINTKLQLLEQGDTSFENKDYKAAEIYFKNSLDYLNDAESALVNSKIQVIKEAIPKLLRKRKINNIIIYLVLIMILLTAGYFYYYYYFLQEERDFANIEKSDNISDINAIESQITKYERYISKYANGKLTDRAQDKIFYLSSVIVRKLYREDWKTSLTYLKKIDENSNPVTHNELFNLIYDRANADFKNIYSKAKKLDTQKKFSEAKDELNRALSITEFFPESELSKSKSTLDLNINLINKKISYERKISDIEKEISLKRDELKKLESPDKNIIVHLNAEIIEEKSPSLYIARNFDDENIVAIRGNNNRYISGQQVNLDCENKGTITIYDNNQKEVTLPLFKIYNKNFENELFSSNNFEKESIIQRLNYLNEQRVKIDSILNLKL